MQVSKPITMNVPGLFIHELNKELISNPPTFNYDLKCFYWLFEHLIFITRIRKNYEFIALDWKNIEAVTGSNSRKYIKYLEKGKFLISDNQYELGTKSKWYKVNPSYLTDSVLIQIKPTSKVYKRIIYNGRRKRHKFSEFEPFLRAMWQHFKNLDMDYAKAKEWLQELPNESKRLHNAIALSMLKDKRFRHFNRNKTNGRLDTNITNMNKGLRQFIIGDFVSIDLTNSQPLLLALLIKSLFGVNKDTLCWYFKDEELFKTFGRRAIRNILKDPHNKDLTEMGNFWQYFLSVLNGSFYNDLISLFDNGLKRDDIKKIMFAVLFSRNEYYKGYKRFVPYEKEKRIFSEVYPFIAEVVYLLKQKGNAVLPIYLQKLESFVFIDTIAQKLVNEGIIPLTIHDSVIVERKDYKRVLKIIQEVFMEIFGIIPSFRVESLKGEPLIENQTLYPIPVKIT